MNSVNVFGGSFTGSLSKLGVEGHWSLPNREQEGAKAIGTDDENKLLRPHSESYKVSAAAAARGVTTS